MRAQRLTLRGRALAESLMSATCEVTRPTGEMSDPDPVTGVESPIVEVIYSGPCKLKAGGTAASEAAIPGMVVVEQDDELHFPVATSGDVRLNDSAVLTSNPLDESVVGVPLRVKGAHAGTFMTARRFSVERRP